jgi:serine/threonine protein kinase
LQYLHDKGLVHQNLKPSSLILAGYSSFHSQGQLKVVGLNLLTKADNQITQSGSAASLSPHPSRPHSTLFHVKSENDLYCAPEVHTKQLSTGADLYSIGALLFTLVTGHSPSSNLIFGKEWQQKEIIEFGFEVSSSFFSLP